MSFLIIDTLAAVGVASAVPVSVELTDGRGDPITGYVTASAQVVVFPGVVTTDENGHVDIEMIPNEDITPGGSCYTVRIAEKQFLIRKSASNQTLLDAVITDVQPLDPVETNDLLDHINDPFNAHGASAISVIPNGDLLGVNVQGSLEELQTEILDHQDDATNAHAASAIAVTPVGSLDSDNVQSALVELQVDITTNTLDLASHILDVSDAHPATAVSFTPAGDIISGDVQAALEEVDEELHTHIDATDDAHDAMAISSLPFGSIEATNVQDALMEIYVEAGGGGGGASMASDVMFTPDGTITSTNVQDALVELDGDIQAHILDSTDAHDASAISAVPFGTVVSDTVQEQIEEVYTLAVVSLDEASEISFAPAGDISATNVQDAIEELDAEKADLNDPRIVRSDDAWTATKEPLGFPSTADNTISVVNAGATYTFSNTPTGASFDIWAGAPGIKHTKSTPQTLSLAKTTGGVYIYYNSSGVLTQSTVKWSWDSEAPVAFFYYSATAGGYFLIDERHGATMDNDTQQYLSETVGSRLANGVVLGNYTLTPSSPTNADVQFSTTAGLLVDADIQYTLPAVAAGGGAGLYGIFYRTGTTEWTVAPSTVPVSVGTTYPRWNENVAGTWQLTEAGNGDYMNMWLMAVPVPAPGLRSYVLIPGENVHANLVDALAESEFTSALLGSFPFSEAVARYKITIQIQSSYTGVTGRFRIRNVAELSGTAVTNSASAEIIDHSILLNRDLAGQHPASAVSFTPYSTLASTDVQSAIQELLDEGGGGGTAATTTFTPTGDIVATNVQDAIVEVDTELHAHEADTVDAHDASAISFVPTGTVSSTTAQAAIAEVATDAAADLADHLADTVDAHDASAVSTAASGLILSSDVQAELNRVANTSVPRFASSGARTTAIPSPTQGQFSYLTGSATRPVEFYNGSAWVPVGSDLGPATAYTPTWTTTGTAPAIGNGSITGTYKMVAPYTMYVSILLTLGSTSTGGTGAMLFSIPSGYTSAITGNQLALTSVRKAAGSPGGARDFTSVSSFSGTSSGLPNLLVPTFITTATGSITIVIPTNVTSTLPTDENSNVWFFNGSSLAMSATIAVAQQW